MTATTPPVSPKDKQDVLLGVVTGLNEDTRGCGATLAALDWATADLRSRGVSDLAALDQAAAQILQAKKLLQQAHTAVCEVALS